jgi:multisubunit Na+/H+ antiporter MnhE subunit
VTGTLVRGAGLAAFYLLVLTSVAPGDVALGAILGLTIAHVVRPGHAPGAAAAARISPRGLVAVLAQTVAEVVRGTWRTARFCAGASAAPGFVEIPRGDRSDVELGVWGVLTGEAPDEVVVDVDEVRRVLVVHLVDASDPDAVRDRHRRTYDTLHGEQGR